MAATAQGFGRFDARSVDLDGTLATCALIFLTCIPVLHAPAALLFLLFGGLLIALRPAASTAGLLQHWPVLVLPVFCVLSLVWSLHPGESLRHGIQLSVTLMIAILIGQNMATRALLMTLMMVSLCLVTLSILVGTYRSDTGALVGLFGSKNEMAGTAALFALTAFGIAAAPGVLLLRSLAVLAFFVGGAAIVLAQSVGGLVYLPVGMAAFIGILVLARVRPAVRVVIGAFMVLNMSLVILAAIAYSDALAQALFDLTGKDVTLTGRLHLWRVAQGFIGESPLLGAGYQAFWVPGYAPAETLWADFGIVTKSGFNFHNAYLSNAVEIGVIGVALQSFMLGAAFWFSGRLALKTGDRSAALSFGIIAMLLAMTMLEVPVFFQFNLASVLVVTTIVQALGGLRGVKLRDLGTSPSSASGMR